MNCITADSIDILIDFGQGFIFPGLHSWVSAPKMPKIQIFVRNCDPGLVLSDEFLVIVL